MALKVWLPLNGNIKNHGTDGSRSISQGSTVAFSEKGKVTRMCYDCATASTNNKIDVASTQPLNFTVCIWFKVPDFNARYSIFNEGREYSTYGWGTYVGATTGKMSFWTGTGCWYNTPEPIQTNTWYHVAISRDSVGHVYYYLNGEKIYSGVGSPNYAESNGNIVIGALGIKSGYLNGFCGQLNDFRYYDECLSDKEVKDISMGLCQHYKLKGMGGGVNVIHNSEYSTNSSWGGVNGGTIGFKTIDGKKTLYANKGTTNYLYCQSTGFNLVAGAYWPLKFRAEVYLEGNEDAEWNIGTWVNDNGWVGVGAGVNRFDTATLHPGWNNIEADLTVYHATLTNKPLIIALSCTAKTMYMYHPKLTSNLYNVQGRTGEPWTPATDDPSYNKLNVVNAFLTDSSGYGNHATLGGTGGTLYPYSTSPRGEGSVHFANNKYLLTPLLPANMNEMTVSYWLNLNADTAGNYKIIYAAVDAPNRNDHIWLSADTEKSALWGYIAGNSPNYTRTTQTTSGGPTLDGKTWYLCTWTWKDGVAKWYLNGELVNTTTFTTKTTLDNSYRYTIGDSYTGTAWSGCATDIFLSDFRIYSTTLAQEDIMELYKVSAWLDNKHTMHAYNFKEE